MRATAMDRVVGIVMALFGLCAVGGSVMAPWTAKIAKQNPNVTPEQLAKIEQSMQPLTPIALTISGILGFGLILGGLGSLFATRWGFVVLAIASGLSVLHGAWMLVRQAQVAPDAYGLGQIVGAVVMMLLYLAVCAYCISRVTLED